MTTGTRHLIALIAAQAAELAHRDRLLAAQHAETAELRRTHTDPRATVDPDPELCGACHAADDACDWHRGVEAGVMHMTRAVTLLAADPDRFNAVLAATD